jgi:hypothetical protein
VNSGNNLRCQGHGKHLGEFFTLNNFANNPEQVPKDRFAGLFTNLFTGDSMVVEIVVPARSLWAKPNDVLDLVHRRFASKGKRTSELASDLRIPNASMT